jgi:hypothetical protein
MPIQLRLQPYQLADLAEIRNTSPERLHEIDKHLRSIASLPLRPRELHQEIEKVLGDTPLGPGQILRPLLALHAIIRQRQVTADDVVDAVRHCIETSAPPWTLAELEKWRLVEPPFKELLKSPVVRLVSNTLDLMYEYANLLQSSRIVTDIRPVFSDAGDRIDGCVISHTLRLRYDSTEGDHGISIAMDEGDIRELARQCNRALDKAQTAQSLMTNQANVPTVISGDGGDAQD